MTASAALVVELKTLVRLRQSSNPPSGWESQRIRDSVHASLSRAKGYAETNKVREQASKVLANLTLFPEAQRST